MVCFDLVYFTEPFPQSAEVPAPRLKTRFWKTRPSVGTHFDRSAKAPLRTWPSTAHTLDLSKILRRERPNLLAPMFRLNPRSEGDSNTSGLDRLVKFFSLARTAQRARGIVVRKNSSTKM